MSTMSVLGSSNSRIYHWILKLFVATYKSEVWEQNCDWIFFYYYFVRTYGVLKLKTSCILLNKNFKKIPHKVLERRTLYFSSLKNHKLKVKLWWAGACEREKRAFFVSFFLLLFVLFCFSFFFFVRMNFL